MANWTTQGVGLKIPATNVIVVPSSISILVNGEEVGFIQKLDYSTKRTVTRIRHLNQGDAGRVINQVPAPEDMTITATGWKLYTSTVIGRITGQGTGREGDVFGLFHTLSTNVYPFEIEIDGKHPVSGKEWIVTHGGCLITDFSTPYDIGGTEIIETMTIQPMWTETELVGGDKEIEGTVIPKIGT